MLRHTPSVTQHDFVRTTVLTLELRQTQLVGIAHVESLVADTSHRVERQRSWIVLALIQRVAVRKLQPVGEILIVRDGLHVLQVEVQLSVLDRVELEHCGRLEGDLVHKVEIIA